MYHSIPPYSLNRTIKIHFSEDNIRRIVYNEQVRTIDAFSEFLNHYYAAFVPEAYLIQYVDEDGDRVTVTSQVEFDTMLLENEKIHVYLVDVNKPEKRSFFGGDRMMNMMEMPTLNVPQMSAPKLEIPQFGMPAFRMPGFIDDAVNRVKSGIPTLKAYLLFAFILIAFVLPVVKAVVPFLSLPIYGGGILTSLLLYSKRIIPRILSYLRTAKDTAKTMYEQNISTAEDISEVVNFEIDEAQTNEAIERESVGQVNSVLELLENMGFQLSTQEIGSLLVEFDGNISDIINHILGH
eukprot:TRINITY_DN9608_c0_g1_i1.p1 TRINITY_DN9608_c0_g1~~TRINITY_DN9608_c0_g1_i1.p1  ORF type:complete len:294 (+),score=61.92 TRINITY_DN9608_c0_g1_i1:48-929(+)